MKQNILVKLSGDAIDLTDAQITWMRGMASKNYVVIVVGGGTQINEAFNKAGHPVKDFGILGRDDLTFEQRQLARDVLEKNQAELQDRLIGIDLPLTVEIPVIQVGSVLCHVNGDQYVLSAYNGFDKIYVVTLPGARHDIKVEKFEKYPKIEIKSFQE